MTKCVLSFCAGVVVALIVVLGLTKQEATIPVMGDGVYRTFMVAPMYDQASGAEVYWVVAGKKKMRDIHGAIIYLEPEQHDIKLYVFPRAQMTALSGARSYQQLTVQAGRAWNTDQ